ncbi:saccharopine dehydrogenase [Amylibacter marinus]|uniref:Saccharopine dehydrogenase [NAD(+), L-lysine-forming] n=1 Tax=Amylibacter marinus TaxID=1475483 RepID=A0ABQ5VRY1_9RHOB|nr:saccharopine dehydrogenase [Amylibacter marinus]GLQ33936.1 saccharopine dehydrogenase [Amylibacter marinus]
MPPKPHIWIRAEQRAQEKRVPVTPSGVRALMEAGFHVTIENSPARAIPLADYAATGCEIANTDEWINSPASTIILGLKELNEDGPDLIHRHIMFGHAYKGQAEGPALLKRFKRGGGTLLDLEYLLDPSGRRVAAFGYWAGYAGAALGLKTWIAQQMPPFKGPASVGIYADKTALINELRDDLNLVINGGKQRPNMITIGALGRVGSGACDLAQTLDLPVTKWDMAETVSGGPFPEILAHDIFVNCILADASVPVFVPKSALSAPRKLSVIADVSCDPNSPYNPIPIYDASHSFADPMVRCHENPPLDVTAIDNLPSMLPVESSEDYAQQLLPHLLTLGALDSGVWAGATTTFNTHVQDI